MPDHNSLDLHVEWFGRLVLLRFKRVDDELHIRWAGLVLARHMSVKTADFGISDDDAFVGNQIFETDSRAQLPYREQ